MQIDIQTETIIFRDVRAVATFSADPDRAPEWYVNIKSVEWLTPPPMRVGSKVAFVAEFLGRRLAYTYEIVVWAPDSSLVMRTADGPFPMETTYRWEALGSDKTRMTLRNRGVPSGFARMAAPVMKAAMRRANEKDLATLKNILEAPA